MTIVCSTLTVDLSQVAGVNDIFRITDCPFDLKDSSGNVYRSFGSLLKIDKATSQNVIASKKFIITLTGLDVGLMELLNSTTVRNKQITIHRCFVNDDSNQITERSIYFTGWIDTPQVEVNYDDGYVTLAVGAQSLFDLAKTPSLMRSNNATHQAFHSGDRFFEYANANDRPDQMWRIP